MSVATHCARLIPQPHVHRARFAAWSAVLFSLDVSPAKLTTPMSVIVERHARILGDRIQHQDNPRNHNHPRDEPDGGR